MKKIDLSALTEAFDKVSEMRSCDFGDTLSLHPLNIAPEAILISVKK